MKSHWNCIHRLLDMLGLSLPNFYDSILIEFNDFVRLLQVQ